jgi:D-tagatose 6-phosphate 4-epimerase
MKQLLGLAESRRSGHVRGIASICSAHPRVIETALVHGKGRGGPVLIEATCNQVNQEGGYTGMTPADFGDFVLRMAVDLGFPAEYLILGGDHLGPNPWRHEDAETAMGKAEAMVRAYAGAGFSKIHLDASMGCRGEPEALDDETTARRAARLARAADEAAARAGLPAPVFIIGTEVPTPGGALHALDGLQPTSPEAARATIATHREVFLREDAEAALDRVIAAVVQPGVEFGHEDVVLYDPQKARALSAALDGEPALVFEAHSTDYQPRDRLAALVGDGYAILKVGPGLTFALREALYGLDLIAGELDPDYGERPLAKAMEALMLAEPGQWRRHYHGTADEQRILRHYSYSDRIRYYWPRPEAQRAVARLMDRLAGRILPPTLLRQFLPFSAALSPDAAQIDARSCLRLAVEQVLDDYSAAAEPRVRR